MSKKESADELIFFLENCNKDLTVGNWLFSGTKKPRGSFYDIVSEGYENERPWVTIGSSDGRSDISLCYEDALALTNLRNKIPEILETLKELKAENQNLEIKNQILKNSCRHDYGGYNENGKFECQFCGETAE